MQSIDNIFTEKEQKYLLECSNRVIVTKEVAKKHGAPVHEADDYWSPDVRKIPHFKFALDKLLKLTEQKLGKNLKISNAWLTKTNGKKFKFHSHDECNYSVVYYLQTTEKVNSGTEFELYGLKKAKQNSILIFDSRLKHRTPVYSSKENRITLVLDINI